MDRISLTLQVRSGQVRSGQVRSCHAATRYITLTTFIGKGEGDSDDEGGAGDDRVGGVPGGDTQTCNVQSPVDNVIITCS